MPALLRANDKNVIVPLVDSVRRRARWPVFLCHANQATTHLEEVLAQDQAAHTVCGAGLMTGGCDLHAGPHACGNSGCITAGRCLSMMSANLSADKAGLKRAWQQSQYNSLGQFG